jgi:hypothetical protein
MLYFSFFFSSFSCLLYHPFAGPSEEAIERDEKGGGRKGRKERRKEGKNGRKRRKGLFVNASSWPKNKIT